MYRVSRTYRPQQFFYDHDATRHLAIHYTNKQNVAINSHYPTSRKSAEEQTVTHQRADIAHDENTVTSSARMIDLNLVKPGRKSRVMKIKMDWMVIIHYVEP